MNELLENNHGDMKTVVETFLIEETVELIYDNEKLDKWNDAVQKLGLVGQTKIAQKDKSPIPFMPMNQQLNETFSTLCPRKVNIKEFDKCPIPVEILDLAAMSINEGHFKEIQIWYDDKSKDPVCVGQVGEYIPRSKNKWYWDNPFKTKEEAVSFLEQNNLEPNDDPTYYNVKQNYLIGRWADVKESLSELKIRARERFIFEQKNEKLQQIKIIQREVDDIELSANLKFGV